MPNRVQRFHRRRITRAFVRLLLKLFTRTTISGQENIPRHGPFIAVGNHVAMIEVALMAAMLPQIAELVGNGDVPLDPAFGWLARWYGFIPIKRGSVDRQALQAARQVLDDGNVLIVFPEGGIWDRNSAARPGVAWLSQQTGAPILPVGFGGVRGALGAAIRLKRPRLTVTIGPLMPAVPCPASVRERRRAVDEAGNEIMRRIRALVPPNDGAGGEEPAEEHYTFRVEITAPDGTPVALPDDLSIPHGEDLSFYFHRQLLIDVLYRNYRLSGVRPLLGFPQQRDPATLGAALDVALDFYTREPGFLGYRLGYARAERVVAGLRALRRGMTWAEQHKYHIRLIPERTIITVDGVTQTFMEPSVRREL